MDSDDVSSESNTIEENVCTLCSKHFKYRQNLKKHMMQQHPEQLIYILKNFPCPQCDLKFPKRFLLTKHKREKHAKLHTNLPKCPLCEVQLLKRNVKIHLQSVHNVELAAEHLKFDSFQAFQKWKKEIETLTKTLFRKERGSRTIKGLTYHYYECHRSRCHISRSTGQRQVKWQGSSRTDRFCPANMKVIEDRDGSCDVQFINKHMGHSIDLVHLNLSTEEKDFLAMKIALKVPFDDILQEVRNTLPSELNRLHLINKQDLRNIERLYNLTAEAVHRTKDCKNLESWVKQMAEKDAECVLYYKAVGEKHVTLQSEDFILVIMNNTQQQLLKKYCHSCVCVDNIHWNNAKGCDLIVLLVLDEKWRSFPVALLFSNCVNKNSLSIFFASIRDKVGPIKPNIFMSDIKKSFYEAWKQEMLPPEKLLFCSWHVEDVWENKISKIINQNKQTEIYTLLRTLLEERNVTVFLNMLADTTRNVLHDAATTDFGTYFSQYFEHKTELWAYCQRTYSERNMDMHLKRMHNALKHAYLNGRNLKRVDKGIHAVLQLIRDKIFDRFILNKGKVTKEVKKLYKRHKEITTMDCYVMQNEDGSFIVSSNDSKIQCQVKDYIKNCACKFICTDCAVCLHRYICTCFDSSTKWNMCKHIHLVCSFLNRVAPTTDILKSGTDENKLNVHDKDVIYVDDWIKETEKLLKGLSKCCSSISTSNSRLTKRQKEGVKKRKCSELIDSSNENELLEYSSEETCVF